MKIKRTLTFHLILTMALLVAGTIFSCIFFNIFFLERYYSYNKQNALLFAYKQLDQANKDGILEDSDYDATFERLCVNNNINIIVQSKDRSWIRSSYPDGQLFQMRLNELGDMLFGNSDKNFEILQNSEQFILFREIDARTQSENLTLSGYLTDGSVIYIRTPLESIRESASITNLFFARVGLVAVILSVFVIVILSRTISRPIKELTEISKRMSDLEFDAKYHEKKHSSYEIEELGHHMNELSETLEQKISELKVANNELLVDIEKKEKIDEMRKEFLSNVSHELKTPLALIQGYAEGLKEGINEDAESREFYCDVIVDETDKMNKMVKKLLSLNQLEFGNDVVEMSRFDITELIRGVILTNMLLAEQEGITFSFEEASCYVWGDEFKVEEVITNYISNAMHYAKGQRKICVFYELKDGILRVLVHNTGDLIPEEELDKVWIKFYKVDKARTREYGGNGIGLSIVKAIMDSFHQSCGVYNVSDGVVFWMELERDC